MFTRANEPTHILPFYRALIPLFLSFLFLDLSSLSLVFFFVIPPLQLRNHSSSPLETPVTYCVTDYAPVKSRTVWRLRTPKKVFSGMDITVSRVR